MSTHGQGLAGDFTCGQQWRVCATPVPLHRRQCLHAYRPKAFHRIPTAHAFLNGLVKGFWKLMCRNPNIHLPVGDHLIVDRDLCKRVSSRVKELRGTSCHTSSMPDIKYVRTTPMSGCKFSTMPTGVCVRLIQHSVVQLVVAVPFQ